MGHYVYKYVYNEEIIYIGKNDTDLYSRLRQHGKYGDNIPEEGWDKINNSDIFYCELPNATMSDVVESELIRRYKPKYNKAKMSEWCGIGFVEPEWKKIVPSNKKNKEEKFVIKKFIVQEDDNIQVLQYIYKNKDKVIIDNKYVYFYTEKENLTKGYTIRYILIDKNSGKSTEIGRVIERSLFKVMKSKSCSDVYCYRTSINKFKKFINNFGSIPILI